MSQESISQEDSAQEFCFCTLAVGDRYRAHARMLAQDIQYHAPGIMLIVLTDRPVGFKAYPHVIAVKHRLQSVKGYHDKRFVLEKALSLFDTCVFVDSDVRIIGPVPPNLKWLPGITARTGCNILKHNSGNQPRKALPIIETVAKTLDIDLQNTRWFHEFMFVIRKQQGAEQEFFKLWQPISYFFELQGLYAGEGDVMGLAAAKAGLTVRFETDDRFPFFKDNIEQVRLKTGQSNLRDKQIYFESHRQIEYPVQSIWKRVVDKITKKATYWYRLGRLKTIAAQDVDLRRLFGSEP